MALRWLAAGIALVGAPVALDLAGAWTQPGREYGFVLAGLAGAVLVRTARATRGLRPGPPRRVAPAFLALGGLVGAAGALGLEATASRLGLVLLAGGALLAWAGDDPVRRPGVALALLLAFVSVPPPREATMPMNDWARDRVAAAAAAALGAVGVDAAAEGDVVEFAGGRLQIISACSGMRSLSVLLAAAFFWTAHAGPRSWIRRGAVLAVTPALAVAANLVRIVATGLAAAGGLGPIARIHDALGFLVFLLPLGAILLLSGRLRDGDRPPGPRPAPGRPAPVVPVGLAAIALVAAAGLVAGRRMGEVRPTAEAIADRAGDVPWRPGRADPWMVEQLRPETWVVRVLEPPGSEPVQLAAFSYRDVRRDASVFQHAPDRCFRTAGWDVATLDDPELADLGVAAFRVERGGESRTVACWYRVGERRAVHRTGLWLTSFLAALLDGRTDGAILVLSTRGGVASLGSVIRSLR